MMHSAYKSVLKITHFAFAKTMVHILGLVYLRFLLRPSLYAFLLFYLSNNFKNVQKLWFSFSTIVYKRINGFFSRFKSIEHICIRISNYARPVPLISVKFHSDSGEIQ